MHVPIWLNEKDALDYREKQQPNLEVFEIGYDSLIETWLIVFENLNQKVAANTNSKSVPIILNPQVFRDHLKSKSSNFRNKLKKDI